MANITDWDQFFNQIQSPVVTRDDFIYRHVMATGRYSRCDTRYIYLRICRQDIVAANKKAVL